MTTATPLSPASADNNIIKIDTAPRRWVDALPLLILAVEAASSQGREMAVHELRRMATAADAATILVQALAHNSGIEVGDLDLVSDDEPRSLNDELRGRGHVVVSIEDAERRWNNGDRLYVFHEQDEEPSLVESLEQLRNTTADRLLALPAATESAGSHPCAHTDDSGTSHLLKLRTGHPWDGRPGFDVWQAQCRSQDAKDALIRSTQTHFWKVWFASDLDEGACLVVLYKPSGIQHDWTDDPHNPHPGNPGSVAVTSS